MHLLQSILDQNIPVSELETLFENETEFEFCLLALVRYRIDGERLANKLLKKTAEFAGCLFYAIDNGGYSMELLLKLFAETKDFTGCEAVAREKGLPKDFIKKIRDAHKN